MSESGSPARERPGGYRRSPGGLVGALVATVLAVLAFVAFRELTRDNAETAAPSVDWEISLKAGRADQALEVLAPRALPPGWRATSAAYTAGAEPTWHLGLLTDGKLYVGIEEAIDDLDDLVAEHVDEDADQGAEVTIEGEQWLEFTDSGGDYALGRTVTEPGQPAQAQLVGGSASEETIRAFVASLESGPAATTQ